jgi:hypothetical protein
MAKLGSTQVLGTLNVTRDTTISGSLTMGALTATTGTFSGNLSVTGNLVDARITNSAVGVVPLIVNAIASTTANLQQWRVNNVNQAWVTSTGLIFAASGFTSPNGMWNDSNQSNSQVNTSTTGTIISRNINDANVSLIVRKSQGTGNILELQTGTSDKKLEFDVNGWLYQNGTRFIHNNGTENIFVGISSGKTSGLTGDQNAGLGFDSLQGLTSGTRNTGVGRSALAGTTSGGSNTAVGRNAGLTNSTGNNNTFLGASSGVTSQLATATNSTALGYESYTDKSNQMVFGNSSVTEFKFDRNASATALLPIVSASASTSSVFERTTTTTNDVGASLLLKRTTSGDMVDGFGSFLTFQIRDNAGVDNIISAVSAIRSGADNSGRLVFNTATTGTLTEKMTILPNGNVGIGTGSPLARLQVATADATQYQRALKLSDGTLTNGSGAYIEFSSSIVDNFGSRIGGGREGANATSFLKFDTCDGSDHVERIRITSAGLVGINETSPSAQLQVKSGATNRVPLIVDTLASHTANLQEWKLNNSNRAFITIDGDIVLSRYAIGLGFHNGSSANNSWVRTLTTGTEIRRNIADTNPALIVNQVHASSTGDLLQLEKEGTDVYAFTHDGTLKAPATFTIDPSAHGDATGKVIILGDLQVDGTTTTINSTTLTVNDKNIELSKGAANKAASDGAGITVDLGTDGTASLLYGSTADRFSLNKGLNISGQTEITSDTLYPLLIERTTTDTNTIRAVSGFRAMTSGDMTDGFGASTNFVIKDSSNIDNTIGSIAFLRSGADNSGRFYIGTSNTGTVTEKMTVLPDGKIGIGTPSPVSILNVVTTSNTDGIQVRRNSVTTGDYAKLGFRINTSELSNDFAQIRAVRTNRAVAADTDLRFATISNGTLSERVTIRDDGNLGIGVVSPLNKLSLPYSSYIGWTWSDADAGEYIKVGKTNNGGGGLDFRSTWTSSATNKLYSFYGLSGSTETEFFTILNGGGVGINETAPGAQLVVKSSAVDRRALVVDTLATGHTVDIALFKANGSDRMIVSNTGLVRSRIGIAEFNDSNNAFVNTAATGTVISRNINDANPAVIVNLANSSATANIATFQKAGANRAVIGNTGSLGIGTAAPTSAVHIKTATSEVKLEAETTTDSGTMRYNPTTKSIEFIFA